MTVVVTIPPRLEEARIDPSLPVGCIGPGDWHSASTRVFDTAYVVGPRSFFVCDEHLELLRRAGALVRR